MHSIQWIRRLALAGVILCLLVVVLGAYVRLSAAGLGCPDWPGCYGHFTPLGAKENPTSQAAYPHIPFESGKAWREMIHRYAASTLGLIIIVITAFAIATRRQRVVPVGYAFALLAIVVFQGILGMLTVTWQLKPLIVTLHLLFGLTTLAMLCWLWLSLRARATEPLAPYSLAELAHIETIPAVADPADTHTRTQVLEEDEAARRIRRFVHLGLITLAAQIALGGWTSSNYAAVACPDLPTCQGQWWPQANFRDAFVLWRGLGINYEGGVLDHPARVAIHLTHRLGAIVASLALLFAALAVLRKRMLAQARGAAFLLLGALALQLAIGVSMVLEGFPLSLAVAHNAGAALLVLAAIALYRKVCDSSAFIHSH